MKKNCNKYVTGKIHNKTLYSEPEPKICGNKKGKNRKAPKQCWKRM